MIKDFRKFFLAAIPVSICVIFLFSGEIMRIFGHFPRCAFNLITGYYCPGCGNTRSLNCLLHGKLLLAVRNNPALPFLSAMLVLYYVELVIEAVGKKVRLIPRSGIFWWTILGLFLIFYVLRNFFPLLAPIT